MTLLAVGFLEFAVERWLDLPTRLSTLSVIANGVVLWLFADNVEDRLGQARFLACYAAAGIMSAGVAAELSERVSLPVVMSSGAVAGVLGAYFVLYPRSRVLMLFPVPLELYEAPALFFLSTFVILQLPFGIAALTEVVAGLIVGAALCLALRRPMVW